MIRFRRREDEARYNRLLSDLYREAAAHLPPQAMTLVMRNLGKLQDMLLLEGVRQGAAAAAVSTVSMRVDQESLEHLKAFQLHAHVYGSSDTPLVEAEAYWLQKLGAEDMRYHPWLDPEPMRFAPETIREVPETKPAASAYTFRGISAAAECDGLAETDEEDDPVFDAEVAPAQSEPDLLDRARDALLSLAAAGVRPRDYQDLVLRLHLTMRVDAAWLDVQLGTAEGRAILAQAGYQDLYPGRFGINLSAIQEEALQDG
jgi:hypothetical protein